MSIITQLEKIFDFIYRAELDNGLTEHEFDHVYAGEYEGPVQVNPEEVNDFCYKSMKAIQESLLSHPKKYTVWFHLAFPRIEMWWRGRYHDKEVNKLTS